MPQWLLLKAQMKISTPHNSTIKQYWRNFKSSVSKQLETEEFYESLAYLFEHNFLGIDFSPTLAYQTYSLEKDNIVVGF